MLNRLLFSLKKTLCALVILIAFIAVLITTVLTLPYRGIVFLVVKALRPDLLGFVETANAYLAKDNYTNPRANIILLNTIDGRMLAERLHDLFQERVISATNQDGTAVYATLKQSFVQFMGYSFLKNDQCFDLRKHVRTYDYSSKKGLYMPSPCYEEDLQRVLGALLTESWDPARSPWEILIIQDYYGDGTSKRAKTVLALRFHHGLGDGYSIFQMLQRLFQDPMQLPPPKFPKVPLWLRSFKLIAFPFILLSDMADQLVDVTSERNDWSLGKDRAKEFYSCFTKNIPINVIKDIRKKFGVNFLSVPLTAIAGAIYRLMKEAGQRPPKQIKCVVTTPMKNHPGGMTQHISFIFATLDIQNRCTVPAMRRTSNNLNKCKHSIAPKGFSMFVNCFAFMPFMFRRVLDGTKFATAIVSTFPVPTEPCYLEGFQVSDAIDAVGPSSSLSGVVVAMCGVSGQLRISITIDKSLMPSENLFRKIGSYIEEELYSLLNQPEHLNIDLVSCV